MITPTVGRRVYYKPLKNEKSYDHSQPFDAGILHVWSDTCINALVTTEKGVQLFKSSVTLAQDREPNEGDCYWMPYQQQQAK